MPRSSQKTIDEIVRLNELIWAKNQTKMADAWPDLELTVPQLRVLTMLVDGPKKMSQIAETLGIHLSSATTLMDRIITKKLAERIAHPTDRRVVLCRLSRQGKELLDRFAQSNRFEIEEISEHIDDDGLEIVLKAMRILLQAIERKYPQPAAANV